MTSSSLTPDFETLRIEHADGVDRLTLNRPDKLNAMSPLMARELHDYFNAISVDGHPTRVVILRSEGKHFCAGFDLEQMDAIAATLIDSERTQRAYAELILRMRRCPQPIIALIQGAAAGAGMALAMAADVRYGADDLRMNVAMSRIGLTGCDMGLSYFLPRAIGASNAAELMMTGRFANAAKALRIGLVSEVVPRDELDALGQALADDMRAMSPLGLRFTKEGLNLAQDAGSLEATLALENRGQVMTILSYMAEGVAAFKERRPASYPKD